MDIGKLLRDKAFWRNLILYGVIGLLAYGVDSLMFYLFNHNLQLNKFIANVISMHIGMAISFSLNSVVNFKKTDKIFHRFLSYYVIILIGVGLVELLILLFSLWIDSNFYQKIIATAIVTSLQFIFNRLITFRNMSDPAKKEEKPQ